MLERNGNDIRASRSYGSSHLIFKTAPLGEADYIISPTDEQARSPLESTGKTYKITTMTQWTTSTQKLIKMHRKTLSRDLGQDHPFSSRSVYNHAGGLLSLHCGSRSRFALVREPRARLPQKPSFSLYDHAHAAASCMPPVFHCARTMAVPAMRTLPGGHGRQRFPLCL